MLSFRLLSLKILVRTYSKSANDQLAILDLSLRVSLFFIEMVIVYMCSLNQSWRCRLTRGKTLFQRVDFIFNISNGTSTVSFMSG